MLLESHPIEKQMGIQYYITQSKGIEGKTRQSPLDFRVEEILPNNNILRIDDPNFKLGDDEPGLFTEFILIKKNIESHNALLKIATALQRNINDINIAGTKDKIAYTAQRATIWRVPPKELLDLKLGGIVIRSPRTTIYKTFLGDSKGNHFTLRIREIKLEEEELIEQIKKIQQEIIEKNGIPNFFGHQRFGTRRPISHLIGREILLGNIKNAMILYLSKAYEDESENTKIARKKFLETNDPQETIKLLPKSMVFERVILEHLTKKPNDYIGAFYKLPKNLRRLFVHSYQSYIWNMTLSERLRLFNNLHPINLDNIENGKQVLPIIGSKIDLPNNELSIFIKELLEKDEIDIQKIKSPIIQKMSFSGSNRSMCISLENFSYNIEKDMENEQINLIMKFSLQPGSYATIVLREFMKTTPLSF